MQHYGTARETPRFGGMSRRDESGRNMQRIISKRGSGHKQVNIIRPVRSNRPKFDDGPVVMGELVARAVLPRLRPNRSVRSGEPSENLGDGARINSLQLFI